jgi:dUTP pyrophosphatase
MPKLYYNLVDPNAVPPQRALDTDTGYDMTIVGIAKVVSDRIVYCDTGIKVWTDPGYYLELVPRSSFSKTGYMMANSFGVLDEGYIGNILVPLIKVDTNAPDLSFPYKGFQLIIRKRIDADEVVASEPTESLRGEGGFGSTDRTLKN